MLLAQAAVNGGVTPPLVTLAVGVVVVLTAILWLRLNAFLGLLAAALAVSLLAPGALAEKGQRVADAFGATAGGIGIAIALAAIIGACLISSGAADRIVQAALKLCGEKRGATALAASGFVLSVPVFFDTVFYLLFPIARSMHRRTGRDYLRYLLAIGSGAAVTHTMIPPTPGPLLMADEIGVSVGAVMLVGVAVSIPMSLSGLAYARWIGRRLKLENEPDPEKGASEPESGSGAGGPPLSLALLPIVAPVAMIAAQPIAEQFTGQPLDERGGLMSLVALVADKNIALGVAAAAALGLHLRYAQQAKARLPKMVEHSLMSAGMIVLITAAGGAFGAMLKAAEVGPAISRLFPTESSAGVGLLLLAAGIASLLKTAQGSTTVALITASGMVAAMLQDVSLGFHRAYLCAAIGSGAMITSWMNDSGFWIYSKMGGLTEREGLLTWTPIMIVMGLAGLAATLLLAWLVPGV